MEKKSILKFLFLFLGLASIPIYSQNVVDLDPNIEITQTVSQKGAVVIKGNFNKPVTSDNVVVTIKYKDAIGNWIPVWHKTFIAANAFSQNLTATFELPASTVALQNVKIELSSNSNLSNWQSIIWQKTVSHYKQSDYSTGKCLLDENDYTYLFTPKTSGTVVLNPDGSVANVKDRVTSVQLPRKLDNIALSVNANGTLDSSNPDAPVINIENPNNLATIASSQKYIYQGSDTSPWEYSYHDPVYMFAGKFSNAGFFINFSNWALPPEEGGEQAGRGYLDFTNPNALVNRYYNLYNYINESLTNVITDQEPVVIVISKITGFRVYKANGTHVTINALSNYNTVNDYGYPPLYSKDRGPGSENFFLSNTSKASIYGVGAIRNRQVTPAWNGTSRPLAEIETEINKFINYVGIFGNTVNPDTAACIIINPGAQPDAVDWTKAPNSYVFTGKDKNGNDVDGLYIPVKKAYEMWKNGGEFMRNDSGNYTPIPSGATTAGLYWEDEVGLIKSVTLEGTGENAKIKVLVNKVKEGNAVVSYRVNNVVYWTWHVWVTDDPTNGSTYHHGFEKDKDGNVVTNWKWMDRNLGATNVNFVGNDWHKSAGLQYQWGRKDPLPSFSHKDLDSYGISGEVNLKATDPDFRAKFLRIRGNKYSAQLNTGTDTPNGNIRFSVQNPINIITTPIYVATKGQPLLNDDEDFLKQKDDDSWMPLISMTTWFSKSKYKVYNPPYREGIVAWDLWGDTRSGSYSDIDDPNAAIAEQSSRYALKSAYDPCPCNWRVPSKYFSGGRNSSTPMPNQNRYSPWGKHTGETTNPEFVANALNTDYPGIKIYPQFGFDFSAVPNMNLGKLPINGNYESYPNNTSPTRNGTGWATPELAYQDSSADGGLFTSTFTTATEVVNGLRYPTYGAAGLLLYSDPLSYHNSLGWNSFRETDYGYPSTGVRCIYDPNSAFTPQEFETEYIASSPEVYSLEVLKSWTKSPNSYIEYTNPDLVTPNPNGNNIDTNKDNDRIIEIPLKKAYAMHKLHLSTDFSLPAESVKSSSVVWTTNSSLIQKIVIEGNSIENAVLKVTLNTREVGNAVVAFHVGSGTWSNGKHNDPVLWSWHIWAPKSVIGTYDVDPETVSNGGIKPANDQFVNPTKSGYGIPMRTTFMDRDLGAKEKLVNEHIYEPNGSVFASGLAAPATGSFPTGNPAVLARLAQISESGGLHYQWGRKDPLPVFYNPGWSYYYYGTKPYATYNVFRQNNPANATTGAIPYTVTMPESEYLSSYTEPFGTYSNNANVSPADSKTNKLKKVLKYSVNNPLKYLYQTDTTKLDWISDENGNMPERWGHATEKSSYDPCPAGWRIVDLHSLSLGTVLGNFISKGNTPWFYNANFNTAYGIDPGQINAVVKYENYDPAKYNYIGGTLYAYFSGRGVVAYGYTLNKPEYNIGLFPNSGIRGFNGSNTMDASVLPYAAGAGLKTFQYSGIWTAANHGTGNSLGMLFKQTANSNGLYYLTPTFGFRPQAGMSCRCTKIEYDANGNEIGRYNPDAIPVPPNANKKANNTFDRTEVAQKAEKLTVFPNPVKDVLHIDAKDNKEYYYQIYNISGQLVKEGKFENNQTNVSSLTTGVYLIRINNSETIVKIIKL